MFTPVGSESAWPVMNPISTASVCPYFEPGAVMGVKLMYQFSEKVYAGSRRGPMHTMDKQPG
jgi:hypothetical protein